jgi:hypothetical protein
MWKLGHIIIELVLTATKYSRRGTFLLVIRWILVRVQPIIMGIERLEDTTARLHDRRCS